MAIGGNGKQTRSASLLRPPTPPMAQLNNHGISFTRPSSGPSLLPSEPSSSRKRSIDEKSSTRDKSRSFSSSSKTVTTFADSSTTNEKPPQRLVRTIPTWVQAVDEEDEEPHSAANLLSPSAAYIAQHNNSPSSKQKHKPEPGRLHDSVRRCEPPTPSGPLSETASRWRAFANASAYPHAPAEDGELMTEDWLTQNGADYSRPWLADEEGGDPEKNARLFFGTRTNRKAWWKRLQTMIMRNSMVPLVVRMIVWTYSLIALALASSIYNHGESSSKSSSIMAICVDALALVYTVYITYDEYTSQPIGLRSARGKMRLIFLDLFFIVFDSANLSLAFETVTAQKDEDAHCVNPQVCVEQKALASVLLIALIAWLLTFSISVLRLIERMSAK